MEEEKRNDRPKAALPLRTAIDMAMGVMYLAIPYYATQTPYILEQFGRTQTYFFSGLFAAYGLFRIVRGLLTFRQQ